MSNEQGGTRLSEQLMRLSLSVENMVGKAEAVHKRLDKGEEAQAELQKTLFSLQRTIDSLETKINGHVEQCVQQREEVKTNDKRLRTLEQWRWISIGAGAAVGTAGGNALKLIGG